MDRALLGSLLLGLAFVPWTVEVFLQVRLQAQFLAALPHPVRAALPRHPRRPWLAFVSSPQFHLALWRSTRRDLPDDPVEVAVLKHKIRTSLRRELIWSLGGAAVLVALIVAGWRPFWPWNAPSL